jgi:hypothetical protein
MAIGTFHLQEAQGPATVVTNYSHCVLKPAFGCASLNREGKEKQHQRPNQKCYEEESMGLLIERFVFARCFFVERTWLETFAAMRAGCRVGKAKTAAAETWCKTHFAYLFLVLVGGFTLIAVYEFFQDRPRVKGGMSVHFQHASHDQMIGVDRRLGTIIVSATFGLDSRVTETPEHGSHQRGLAAQAATSKKYRGAVIPHKVTNLFELLGVYSGHTITSGTTSHASPATIS